MIHYFDLLPAIILLFFKNDTDLSKIGLGNGLVCKFFSVYKQVNECIVAIGIK